MRRLGRLFLILGICCAAPARAQDLTLTGTITGADHQTWREVPFQVPPGMTRISVAFDYTGREARTVVDLGLRDPHRFRGWSGGNKAAFTVAETDATPSYLPGPLPAGTWALVLGVPNIRQRSVAAFTARITFDRDPDAPLATGPRWWRGDLHMHTGHSDGSCLSRKGAKVPCPVFRTLEAAAGRLDFVAVSDHNATSQNASLRELAPYFDDLLAIPAREFTSFHGHANILGPTGPLDFRRPDVLAEAAKAGGLVSINHPALPSGEACMGCGWTAPTDWSGVHAIEVVNGASQGAFSGIAFWEARLNEGRRITAIGGSDNHDPTDAKRPIGVPTTVVYAPELSRAAILDGIRRGHAYIDVAGSGARLDLTAASGGATAMMGEALAAPAGAVVEIAARAEGIEGAVVAYAGSMDAPGPRIVSDGRRHWIRADVRGPDGRLRLVGNPIYLNH